MRVIINHGSMGSLHIISARENQVKEWVMFFLLLKLLYCKVTGFLLLGMGQVIRTVLVRIGQFTLLLNMARKGLIGCRCHVLICTSTDFFGEDDDTRQWDSLL